MKSYVEILEGIRDTRYKLEEIPQDEYKEVSHGICYGHIKVVEGYLFLTPLGASIVCDFYRRKMEIEGNEVKPSSVVDRNFENEGIEFVSWFMIGFVVFMFLVACFFVSC